MINYILLALLSGLLLNLMPCALPILSIKAMSVVKLTNAKDRSAIKISSLATFAGILIFFLAIAALICYAKYMHQNYVWGSYFQDEEFLIAASLILFYFLGLSVNYNLFSFKTQKDRRDSIIQGLIYGITIPLISTPCMGPFMSSVVTFIISSADYVEVFIITLALGVGFGSPYLLIALLKNPSKIFPKPGKWMLWLRYISFFMISLTILWMNFILYQNISGLLYISISLTLGFILFMAVKKSNKVIKTIIFLMLFIVGGIIATNALKIYFDYKHTKLIIPEAIPFSMDELDKQVLIKGNTVVVRFTADWCATCKMMDVYLFSSSEVADMIQSSDIVYMVADLTSKTGNVDAKNFMTDNRIRGIPAIYIANKKNPAGTVYTGLMSKQEFVNIIKQSKD
jgi:suppressor for copper-sensitivity B